MLGAGWGSSAAIAGEGLPGDSLGSDSCCKQGEFEEIIIAVVIEEMDRAD